MSVAMLEIAAADLGKLTDQVVFVGGATVPLWITDPASPESRETEDVDIVVDVVSRSDFRSFEEGLRHAGFKEDQQSGVICRWRHKASDLIVDAMAARAEIQGFENRWQRAALPTAADYRLPSGASIRVASAPYLFAMKLEAFASRGRNDFYGSRDFEDIVRLIDGRAELLAEIEGDPAVGAYVAKRLSSLLAEPRMRDGALGALPADVGRVEAVVLPAMRRLAGQRP